MSTIQSSTLCIDCSTIDIQASKRIAQLCANKLVRFNDAPVSGGVKGEFQTSSPLKVNFFKNVMKKGAEMGTLTFMVGAASKQDFEAIKPFLEAMGKNIVHAGDVGHGLAAKICNNMMLGISMIGVAETMNLGIRYFNTKENHLK